MAVVDERVCLTIDDLVVGVAQQRQRGVIDEHRAQLGVGAVDAFAHRLQQQAAPLLGRHQLGVALAQAGGDATDGVTGLPHALEHAVELTRELPHGPLGGQLEGFRLEGERLHDVATRHAARGLGEAVDIAENPTGLLDQGGHRDHHLLLEGLECRTRGDDGDDQTEHQDSDENRCRTFAERGIDRREGHAAHLEREQDDHDATVRIREQPLFVHDVC